MYQCNYQDLIGLYMYLVSISTVFKADGADHVRTGGV